MATRTARVAWTGNLQQGSGKVELTSSGVGTFDVSFPKRTAEKADGTTSPEELIAAAHASCFSMALSAGLADAGNPVDSVKTDATVTLRIVDGAPTITSVALRTVGVVPGLDNDAFKAAADVAKKNCPVSKALAGVPEITLDASLA
jgi:lipoyl-dependent peroxiredoxin